MGALFELLAQLFIAFATAALAQLGAEAAVSGAQEPPSVQRTVLQNAPQAAAKPVIADEDCAEASPLRTA